MEHNRQLSKYFKNHGITIPACAHNVWPEFVLRLLADTEFGLGGVVRAETVKPLLSLYQQWVAGKRPAKQESKGVALRYDCTYAVDALCAYLAYSVHDTTFVESAMGELLNLHSKKHASAEMVAAHYGSLQCCACAKLPSVGVDL